MTRSTMIRLTRRVACCLTLACSLLASLPHAMAADEARRLIALADYIGGDYKNAVQEGKVINPDEYQEMKEFSRRALELFNQLKQADKGDKAGVEADLKTLASYIDTKEKDKAVNDLARRIKENLLAAYKIVPHPKAIPSAQIARTTFAQNCASCHGESGKGDGPSRATLNPKEPPPANFTDPEIMAALSPFKAFNTVSFGVERTAMPSFAAQTEEERWQTAFYIFSFRFSPEAVVEGKRFFQEKKLPEELRSVATLATFSDEELQERLGAYFSNAQEASKVLAYLRRGVLEERTKDPLLTARTLLSESMGLYENGERERAYQKAVDAYLEGFELIEPALFARDLSFGRALEGKMTAFRSAVKQGETIGKVQELYQEIDAGLAQASQLLSSESQLTHIYIFLNAFLIILREGIEAALVIAAILAFLKVTGSAGAASYIHVGWVIALIAGIFTWILAQTAIEISGAHRESIEGFTTLAAAFFLLYVGYWLHTKAEAQRWQKFVRERVHEALSGQRILTLVGISFFAVYREAFETVLFYQALYLQVPNTPGPVIWGFFAGAAALGVVVFAILKIGLKIPLKYFFSTTGALLYVLALAFAGQGVKELQAAGWMSVTPLSFLPQIDLLGIYPTLETMLAQGVVVLVLIGAMLWLSRTAESARANVR
jgi:high-affinity iron transporter